MVRYLATVKKRLTVGDILTDWSNVYHVEAGDPTAALAVAVQLSTIEQQIHKDYVQFTWASVLEDQVDPPPGMGQALTGFGDIVGDETLRLPNFNTVRVLLSDGNGRPSQKYLRLPLEEGDVLSGQLTTALINSVMLNYVTDLLTVPELVSNTDNSFTAGTVYPYVQMRQRSWNRRTRPGFVRGWVPV